MVKFRPIINILQYKICAFPIPRPYARAGEVKYFKTWNFSPKNNNQYSSVIFTGDLDKKTQVSGLLTANYN